MKKHIVITFCLATLLVSACGDAPEQTGESGTDTGTSDSTTLIDKTKELGQESWDKTKEVTGDTAETAGETSQEIYESAKETTTEAYEATKDAATSLMDSDAQK